MICKTLKTKSVCDEVLSRILEVLPPKYNDAYLRMSPCDRTELSEIRIRADRPCSFTSGKKNIVMRDGDGREICSDTAEIGSIIARACEGSVYSVSSCINDGYIPFCGTRIGVCGTGTVIDGRYTGQRDITTLAFRIPNFTVGAADKVYEHILRYGIDNTMGVLAIAPPNCGKTTFLRALAYRLSSVCGRAEKVCIIDERGELYNKSMMSGCLCDVISGIPKLRALEMAIRTLSPRVAVFDEIGNEEQAELLCRAYSGGIHIAASLHGNDLDDAMRSEAVRGAIKKGVFSTVYLMNDNTAYGDGRIISISETGE